MKAEKVLIVGEHSLSRAFVRAWLGSLKNLTVVAEASGEAQTLVLTAKWKPGLILIDLETIQSVDLGLVPRLKLKHPGVKVIVYFAYGHDNIAIKVIRTGATGFVVKSAHGRELENAIRTVLGGGVYLSPEFLRFVGSAEGLTGTDGRPLSGRQTEILTLIAQGLSTKAIAFELKLSGKTVDVHKQSLCKRLGLRRAGELFKYSIGAGLASA